MGWFEDEIKNREEGLEQKRIAEKEKKEKMEGQIAFIRKSNTAKLQIALDRFRNFKREELKNQKRYACDVDSKGGRDAKSGEDYISEAIFYFRIMPLRSGTEKHLTKKNSPYISLKAEGTVEKFTLEKNFREVPGSSKAIAMETARVRTLRVDTPGLDVIDASGIDEAYVDKLIREFVTELLRK